MVGDGDGGSKVGGGSGIERHQANPVWGQHGLFYIVNIVLFTNDFEILCVCCLCVYCVLLISVRSVAIHGYREPIC